MRQTPYQNKRLQPTVVHWPGWLSERQVLALEMARFTPVSVKTASVAALTQVRYVGQVTATRLRDG